LFAPGRIALSAVRAPRGESRERRGHRRSRVRVARVRRVRARADEHRRRDAERDVSDGGFNVSARLAFAAELRRRDGASRVRGERDSLGGGEERRLRVGVACRRRRARQAARRVAHLGSRRGERRGERLGGERGHEGRRARRGFRRSGVVRRRRRLEDSGGAAVPMDRNERTSGNRRGVPVPARAGERVRERAKRLRGGSVGRHRACARGGGAAQRRERAASRRRRGGDDARDRLERAPRFRERIRGRFLRRREGEKRRHRLVLRRRGDTRVLRRRRRAQRVPGASPEIGGARRLCTRRARAFVRRGRRGDERERGSARVRVGGQSGPLGEGEQRAQAGDAERRGVVRVDRGGGGGVLFVSPGGVFSSFAVSRRLREEAHQSSAGGLEHADRGTRPAAPRASRRTVQRATRRGRRQDQRQRFRGGGRDLGVSVLPDASGIQKRRQAFRHRRGGSLRPGSPDRAEDATRGGDDGVSSTGHFLRRGRAVRGTGTVVLFPAPATPAAVLVRALARRFLLRIAARPAPAAPRGRGARGAPFRGERCRRVAEARVFERERGEATGIRSAARAARPLRREEARGPLGGALRVQVLARGRAQQDAPQGGPDGAEVRSHGCPPERRAAGGEGGERVGDAACGLLRVDGFQDVRHGPRRVLGRRAHGVPERRRELLVRDLDGVPRRRAERHGEVRGDDVVQLLGGGGERGAVRVGGTVLFPRFFLMLGVIL